MKGHAHWVNTLAVSGEYVLRTGCHDHLQKQFDTFKAKRDFARERYEKIRDKGGERLVSGSDDFTMIMWQPKKLNKPLVRMTGH